MKLAQFLVLFVSLLLFSRLSATHNRAGEITYEQIGPNTIQATITTYTKISGPSLKADRAELELHWGDGKSQKIQRSSFQKLAADIRQNFYIATHTYSSPSSTKATYKLWVKDPNRNENILNINGGNSVNIEFFLQSEVVLFSPTSGIQNSSAQLLAAAIDIAYLGQVFEHTPAAFDLDGDSIVYELITPLSALEKQVPAYQSVDQIVPGPANTYTFDTQTGIFSWDAPQECGEYNIAYAIKSYRNGIYMGMVIRDLQILVKCNTQSNLDIRADENQMLRVLSHNVGDTVNWDFLVLGPTDEQAGIDLIAADFILDKIQVKLIPISTDSQLLKLSYVTVDLNREYDLYVNLVVRAYLEDASGNQYAAYDAIPMMWEGNYELNYDEPTALHPTKIPEETLDLVLLGNPVQDQIRIKSDYSYKNVKLNIFDQAGRIKHSENINQLENIWAMDVSNWSNGIYYLKFSLPSKDYQIIKLVVEN